MIHGYLPAYLPTRGPNIHARASIISMDVLGIWRMVAHRNNAENRRPFQEARKKRKVISAD